MENFIAAAVLFLANLFIATKPSLPELFLEKMSKVEAKRN